MKTIVFTGMMGAGKTTLAKLLANALQLDFIDTDFLIEQQEKKLISEIFAKEGEAYFRKLEEEIIKKNFTPCKQVISLGGGAFENPKTRDLLLKNAIVIYLEATPTTILSRVKNNNKRPLLNDNMNIEKITKIIKMRETNYKSAHITINTDNKIPQDIIQEITGALNI